MARKAAQDPQPVTTTDELLAQVRDELRGLRADLTATGRAAKSAKSKPVEITGQ